MVGLESRPLAAIRASPVPPLQELNPFDSRVRASRAKFASAPSGVDALPDVAVLPSVLREVSRESFLVAFVMGPDLSGVFAGMSLPPTPHRFPGPLRIAFDPVARVLASTFGVLIWHGFEVPGEPTRSNRTQQKSAVPRAAPLLRGNDSNVRPSGYEPDELPLLHPANQFYL